ncbi:vanadium-dependent haloperoxidase [Actinoplanes sp. CA-030573]|uniref:vanadium-dependent haloperoxidase n=1 Tax=Actinoplanes sp. CA-030573 TaxID=3239898 RepID=UPI003D912B40
MRRIRSLAVAAAAAVSISAVGTVIAPPPALAIPVPSCDDHAIYWNQVLLTAYASATGGNASPTRLSRAGAMMHLAMYDTAVSLGMAGTPYLTKVAPAAGYSYDPIMNYDTAASTMLKNLFPSLDTASYYTTARKNCVPLEPGPNGLSTDVATRVVQNIMSARANDHSTDTTAYAPSLTAGQWRPTESGKSAVDPNWGKVTPFGLASPSQFRPSLPGGFTDVTTMLHSTQYAQQVNEVRAAGSASAPVSARTADQTVAAHFWANDLDGTYKPPGQLFKITQDVAAARSGTNRIKLFALVSMAMADAGITAWDAKFDTSIDLWRPDTAIAEPQGDGNAATTPDAAWQPLSADRSGNHFSPPFPAYISGHATFAGAWAGIMKRYYGTDAVTFTAGTQDPYATGVTRTFTSFSAAATEDAMSRLWLGVHFRWDADSGLSSGDQVAAYIVGNKLL